jgi:hypothetical protein
MKKVKKHFQNSEIIGYYKGKAIYDYPYLRSSCIKCFSTLNEAKQAFKVKEDEYRNLYKIRAKRDRKGLPNPWDDYPTTVYALGKSWKHNSKRVNQW